MSHDLPPFHMQMRICISGFCVWWVRGRENHTNQKHLCLTAEGKRKRERERERESESERLGTLRIKLTHLGCVVGQREGKPHNPEALLLDC